MPESTAAPDSLEKRCEELSKQGDYHYQVVSGAVVRAHKMMPPGDCFSTPECMTWLRAQNARFVAEMKTLNSASNGPDSATRPDFIVKTRDEKAGGLEHKPPYMTAGATYAFCARETKNTAETAKGLKEYIIDFVDTIHELK